MCAVLGSVCVWTRTFSNTFLYSQFTLDISAVCTSVFMVLCLITVVCYDGTVNCGRTEDERMWKQGPR